jgi:NADH-quinone oxidoreductase subunit F
MAETAENIQVLICTGTGGFASGAQRVIDAFEAEFAKQGVEAKVGKRCDIKKTGCRGLCANDVLVDIVLPGQEGVTYDFVTPELVPQIVEEHILANQVVEKKKAGKYYGDFLSKQQRIIFSRCGTIDAESMEEGGDHDPRAGHRGSQALRPARPRGRRLSDRRQVVVL